MPFQLQRVDNVPPILSHIWFLLKEMLRIPLDVLSGTSHRHYQFMSDIKAGKSLTWSIASANKIKLEGAAKLEIDTEPDANRPGVFTGFCRTQAKAYAFAYRVLDERPGEAMTLQVIEDESDKIFRYGDGYTCSVVVAGNDASSTIVTTYDLTHFRFGTRVSLPIALLLANGRIKRTAEVRAGTWDNSPKSRIKNAIITGALTFASFFVMFGASSAAALLGLILIHEFGHVIAMRWLGIPVRGIYFVPFFGGVAVGDGTAKSKAARGLVALMGPAFSILTTALLLWLPTENGIVLPRQLAMMSALLNGFNLLPLLPLDGGQVAQSLLSRFGAATMRGFRILTGFTGCALALWIGDFVLLAVFAILLPSMMARGEPATQLPALSRLETVLLASAYVATIVYYGAVIGRLWGIKLL